MAIDQLLERCRDAAGIDPQQPQGEDSLIGFFQMFRPDGRGLVGIFEDVPRGDELQQRLDALFAVAGNDRRPQGGRDAYFVVRQPEPASPDRVQALADAWLENMSALARELDDARLMKVLDPVPKARVLEGQPPKNPKVEEEKSDLLVAFQSSLPKLITRVEPYSPYADALSQAYYFISCDAMLRDYLMWPLHADAVQQDDPFLPYFELWKHRIKFRIFGDDRIDFYMPRYGLPL